MIASHYKLFLTIGEVRNLCKTDIIGTNFAGLVHAAEELGFTTGAMRGEVTDSVLDGNIITPFIAHVRVPDVTGKIQNHYVVVKEISKSKVTVWNPDISKGKYKIKRTDFLKIWTGYVLFLSPTTFFKTQKGQKSLLTKYLPLLVPHKKDLLIITLSSVLLVIFGVITAYYYKYIMDDVIAAKSAFTLTAFSIGVILVVFTQSVVESLRRVLLNHFSSR